MWGGWALELGRRLDGATRRPVAGDVFAAIGFDPASGRVRAGAPLAVATMGEIAEIVAAVIRRWCPSIAAARRAVETAWFRPDPVASAIPTADLAALFGALRDSESPDRRRHDRRPGPDRGRPFAASASGTTCPRSPAATTGWA